ncbi:MAG: response regulator [Hyphomicrobiales bacterium]|nr:MAG: response regulator [Hyphomicrobiales bacterium]
MLEPRDENDGEAPPGAAETVDFGLALVVGSSPITRVVVSRIAERAGLRTVCRTSGEVQPVVAGRLPAIAILDGGADGRDCDRLAQQLAAMRRPAGRAQAPLIILLANHMPAAGRPRDGIVDVVLAKPITPDRLQPIIRDMMDRLRG